MNYVCFIDVQTLTKNSLILATFRKPYAYFSIIFDKLIKMQFPVGIGLGSLIWDVNNVKVVKMYFNFGKY